MSPSAPGSMFSVHGTSQNTPVGWPTAVAAAAGKKKIVAQPPQTLPQSSDSRLDANPHPDRSPSGTGIKPKPFTPTSQGPTSPGT